MIETASDNFLKMDPDPLDDRHPVRTHPHAPIGNLLKALFKRDEFMNKVRFFPSSNMFLFQLVISYLSNRDNVEVCISAARLLLACVPGLDSEVVFSVRFFSRYNWYNILGARRFCATIVRLGEKFGE